MGSGKGGEQWNKLPVNEKIIVNSLYRLPEHHWERKDGKRTKLLHTEPELLLVYFFLYILNNHYIFVNDDNPLQITLAKLRVSFSAKKSIDILTQRLAETGSGPWTI